MVNIEFNAIKVRAFNQADIKQLWQLMHELAVFEGYVDEFKVTEQGLKSCGLGEHSLFDCFVATKENSHQLLGMAVVHQIDWTFDLKPTLVLKELYVKAEARNMNIGTLLMQKVAQHAKSIGAPRVKWLVLNSNDEAKGFYHRMGATPDSVWENWQWDQSGIDSM